MPYIKIFMYILTIGLIWGCTYKDKTYDKTIVNGVYASKSGYSIELNEDDYTLCKSGKCVDGKVHRPGPVYLMNFRGSLTNSGERSSLPFDYVNAHDRHNFNREGYDLTKNMDIELFNNGNNRQYKKQCQLKSCFWLMGYEDQDYFFKLQDPNRVKPMTPSPTHMSARMTSCATTNGDNFSFEDMLESLTEFADSNSLGIYNRRPRGYFNVYLQSPEPYITISYSRKTHFGNLLTVFHEKDGAEDIERKFYEHLEQHAPLGDCGDYTTSISKSWRIP